MGAMMEIQRIVTNSYSVQNTWVELLKLYEDAGSLYQDMLHNPQNTLIDLDQLIALAQKMEAISSKMPIPPSAPDFRKDFEGFLSSLIQMKDDYLSGVAFNFNSVEFFMKKAGTDLNYIFHDIMK